LQGGSSADQVNKELFAPGVAGDYLLKGTLTVYYTYFSAFNTNTDSYLVNNVTFTGLKEALLSYAQAALELAEYEQFEDDLSLKYSLSGIQNVVLDYSLPFYITESVSEDIAKQDHFDIPLTVVGATVNVTIMDNEDTTQRFVEGPVLRGVGQNVTIRWVSKGADSCRCRCLNPKNESEEISCGSEPLNPADPPDCGTELDTTLEHKTIYNLVRSIQFKVTCPSPIE
jgi:hypothetical protein